MTDFEDILEHGITFRKAPKERTDDDKIKPKLKKRNI